MTSKNSNITFYPLKFTMFHIVILSFLWATQCIAQQNNQEPISKYQKSQMAKELGLENEIAIQFDSINKSYKTEINTIRIKSSSKKNLKKLTALEEKRDAELKNILTAAQFQNYLELRREQRKDMQSLIRKKQ